jgi:hypothetical protein
MLVKGNVIFDRLLFDGENPSNHSRIEFVNLAAHILTRRGNNFPFSLGEKAGMRAGFIHYH